MSEAKQDLILSWDDIHRASKALARKIHAQTDQEYTGILAITRGGLIPAGIIARELGIRLIDTISVHSYAGQDQQKELKILKQPVLENGGAGWLVIDDLSDSGNTFRAVREIFPNAHNATLYAKPKGVDAIDTYIQDVGQNVWIHFPWDLSLQYDVPIAGDHAA